MYILSIDQGTTGTTAILIETKSYKIIGKVNHEFKQIFPIPGFIEHDLNDIWSTVSSTILELLKKENISSKEIQAIGITNQRETTCAFTKDGTPLHNAIVWQDKRTHEYCLKLKEQGLEEKFKSQTGLPLDPYFSGSKIHWLLNHVESIKKERENKNLLFGTIDTFILYKLTGNTSYKTDASNASRTLLMDLDTCNWNDQLCSTFGIDKELLPEICNSIDDFGKTKNLNFLPDGIPITGILGDQQAALFGQACFEKGESKCTYGTGAFMLVNTGTQKKYSKNNLLTTVAYRFQGKTIYALEGPCYIAGACIQWLRDQLKFFESSPEVEDLAQGVKDLEQTKDLFLFPFFTGIGAPHWKPNARGALIGLTRGTGQAEISKVALEGIAYAINDLLNAFSHDLDIEIKELKVDGGAVENNFLMQIQSDISNLNLIRPKVIETTAYGAALAAAVGIKAISLDEIKQLWRKDKVFSPTECSQEKDYYQYKFKQWNQIITKLF